MPKFKSSLLKDAEVRQFRFRDGVSSGQAGGGILQRVVRSLIFSLSARGLNKGAGSVVGGALSAGVCDLVFAAASGNVLDKKICRLHNHLRN